LAAVAASELRHVINRPWSLPGCLVKRWWKMLDSNQQRHAGPGWLPRTAGAAPGDKCCGSSCTPTGWHRGFAKLGRSGGPHCHQARRRQGGRQPATRGWPENCTRILGAVTRRERETPASQDRRSGAARYLHADQNWRSSQYTADIGTPNWWTSPSEIAGPSKSFYPRTGANRRDMLADLPWDRWLYP